MMVKNKRGASAGLTVIALGLLVFFIAVIFISTYINYQSTQNVISAMEISFDGVADFAQRILYPLLNVLLNLKAAEAYSFLMILTFILMSVVFIGTLDSINIFGDTKTSGLMNFIIGIIVAIIGIRFMPPAVWGSLTAPASALVATILLGIPFAALTFVTMKLQNSLARKTIWLFYIIFTLYLVSSQTYGALLWVYFAFLVIAGAMMFFDASLRKFMNKQMEELYVEKEWESKNVLFHKNLMEEIGEYTDVLMSGSASDADVKVAEAKLKELEKRRKKGLKRK